MTEQTIEERENDPKHIAVCLNDLANRLKQMAKYLESAADDARRIALNLSRESNEKYHKVPQTAVQIQSSNAD